MPDRIPFRARAHEVSRLEAFSDIVFGFALTLLVVSLEVPQTFDELLTEVRGFVGFAICFAILIWIWHAHYTFFRRYALHDEYTIVANAILLFVILFYVYPLKFLFALVTGALYSGAREPIRAAQAPLLFQIYGAGFASTFLLLLLLYAHAYRQRRALDLNAVEIHDTVASMWNCAGYASVAVLSMVIAAFARGPYIQWAGWIYCLLGPVGAFIGRRMSSRRRAIEAMFL